RDRNETHLRRKQPLEKLTPLRKFPQPLLSRKRHDNIIITLRGLCTFCFEERWLESNPGEHLRWQGYIKRAFAIPTYDETVQLLKVIDPFFRPLVETALYTGCRMGELLAAEHSWIDWGHGRLNVNGSYTHGHLNDTTKSGDTRVVPLPKRLLTTLKKWQTECPSDTILFPSKAGNRLSLDTFRERTWNPAVAAIGRPELSPHCLRHTFITWVVRQAPKSGATSLAIARVSGHKQISSVEWYVETWNDQLDAIARGFDESKEDLNLRLKGLSTEQLLTDWDNLIKNFVKKPEAESEIVPKPKSKGIVLKGKKAKQFPKG
ncbi:MAG TPA: site-specific integrase, partial [Coriobacteriia bacterium]